MTHRRRRYSQPKKAKPKKVKPVATLEMLLPAPVKKPVVTWRAIGRKVRITIRDWFNG